MPRNSSGRAPRAARQILIVDNHPLVRRGLAALIEVEPDLTVCAEASTQATGLEAVASFRPDLVMADFSLGDRDGLTLVKDIRSGNSDLPVLVLSMHDAPFYVERAFRAGASGYVTKKEPSEIILTAIRCVLSGEKFASPRIATGLDTTW